MKSHKKISCLFPSVNKIERWLFSYKYRKSIHLYRIRPIFRVLRRLNLSTYFQFNRTSKRFRKAMNAFLRIHKKNVSLTFFILKSFRWLRDIHTIFYIKKYLKRKNFKKRKFFRKKKFRRFFFFKKKKFKNLYLNKKVVKNKMGILKRQRYYLLKRGYYQIFLYKWYRNSIIFPTFLKQKFFLVLKKKKRFLRNSFFLMYTKSFIRLYSSKFFRIKISNFFIKGFFFIKNLTMNFFFFKNYLYKISPPRYFRTFKKKFFFKVRKKYFKKKKPYLNFKKFIARTFAYRFFRYNNLGRKKATQNSICLNILTKINRNFNNVPSKLKKRVYFTNYFRFKNPNFRFSAFNKIKRKKKFFLYFKKLMLFKPIFLAKYGIGLNNFLHKIKNYKNSVANSNYNQFSKANREKAFNSFESLLSTVIVNLFRCRSVLFAIRLIKQGAISVNSRAIYYPKYSVRIGDLVSAKVRHILLNMRYFKFRPYGFFLQMLVPWKFSYFSVANLKIFAGIFYRSFQLAVMSFNHKLFNKRWLFFFFFFVK